MTSIPQIRPHITEREVEAVTAYLRSGGWLSEFTKTAEFEERLAEFLGVRYAVVVPSGTAALYLAVRALGIGPGDCVVVPDYTMIASPNSVRWAGADVQLCDVDPDTFCLDIQQLAAGPNLKAVMFVALNGRCGNMDTVVEFCRAHGLYLIEDACQALGSRWGGRFLGTLGDVGVFSFTPHKIITTGNGGAVVTNDKAIYRRVKALKDFCRVRPGVDVHTDIGFNFKFTDLQAVVGIEQLKTIEYRIGRKKEIYEAYRGLLADVDFIEWLPMDLDETVPWFVDVLLKDVSRKDFIDHMAKQSIGTRPIYPPIHTQEPYADHRGPFPVASDLCPRGVWLPSSIGLDRTDIERITAVVLAYRAR